MDIDKIVLGDCYELIKELPKESVDLIITDPPYDFHDSKFQSAMAEKRTYVKEMIKAKITNSFNFHILDDWLRVMKKINIYIWCNKEQLVDYLNYFVEERGCNFEIIIWAKTNPAPFTCGHYLKDKEYCLYFWEKGVKLQPDFDTGKTVYYSKVGDMNDIRKQYYHPTMKPEFIIENMIKNSSKEGDIILDTFSGSGTTCCVAKKLNRHYLGFEINKDFYERSISRLNESEQLRLF